MFDWSTLMSPSDAEKKYGKCEGTIRKGIAQGKFEAGVDCYKFGKQWVMSVEALEREYGNNKRKRKRVAEQEQEVEIVG